MVLYFSRHICTYELEEALWSGVVVSPLIGKVDFAHIIDTAVSIGHELADRLTQFRLQER